MEISGSLIIKLNIPRSLNSVQYVPEAQSSKICTCSHVSFHVCFFEIEVYRYVNYLSEKNISYEDIIFSIIKKYTEVTEIVIIKQVIKKHSLMYLKKYLK